MPLTPVDFDPFAGAPAAPAPTARAPKLTPVDYDPFAGTGPSQGRDASGQMLFPSAFIERPADPVGDMLDPVARKVLNDGFSVVPNPVDPVVDWLTPVPGPPGALPLEPLPLGEAVHESAKGGLSQAVGGTLRGVAEKLAAPFDVFRQMAEDEPADSPLRALGELFGGPAAFYDPAIETGADVAAMGQAQAALGRAGAIDPQTVDELVTMSAADPEGAARLLLSIGAESAPSVLLAMATRNPAAAEAVMGTTTWGSTYGQQRADGATRSQADLAAQWSALLEAAGSRAPAQAALGGVPWRRRLVETPLVEGASELATGSSQSVATDLARGRPVNDDRAALEGLLGLGAGTVIGLGEAAVGKGPTDPVAAALADAGLIDSAVIADVLRTGNTSSTERRARAGGPLWRPAGPAGPDVPASGPIAAVRAAQAAAGITDNPEDEPELGDAVAPAVEPAPPGLRSREEREAARTAAIADLPYADLDGQTATVERSAFVDGGAEDVTLSVRGDGSVSAIRADGQVIDITAAIKAGLPVAEALQLNFAPVDADLGDAVAPVSGAPAPAAPANVGGSPAEAGADSPLGDVVTASSPLLPEDQRDTAPVGSRVDGGDVPGVGRVVWEIRDVPLDALELPEVAPDGTIPSAGKDADAAAYADRLRAGEQAPNARGFALDNGRVKLADGHRRALAARAAGQPTLRVAVATYPDEVALGDAVTPPAAPAPAAVETAEASAGARPATTTEAPPVRTSGEAARTSDDLGDLAIEDRLAPRGTALARAAADREAAAPAPVAPPAPPPFVPGGRMFAQGKNAQAVQLADGTWRVRIRKSGQWQPWEKRDTFDASGAFGYRPFTPPGGAVNIDGKQIRLAPKSAPAPKPDPNAPKKPRTLLEALARSKRGLDRAAWQAEGVDPRELTKRTGFGYVFRKEGGMTPDEVREMLVEDGYLPPDPVTGEAVSDASQAIDLVMRALAGEDIFSADQQEAVAAWEAYGREQEEQYRADLEATLADQLPDITDEDMPEAVAYAWAAAEREANLQEARYGADAEANEGDRRAGEAGRVRATADADAAPAERAAPQRGADAQPREAAPVSAPSPNATSTKNAVTAREREARGADPILAEAAQSNERTLELAQAVVADNPDAGREVAAKLRSEGPAAISLLDEAVLLVEKVRLRNARDAAAARAGDPAATPEARDVARRAWDEAEAAINELDQAAATSGREWGRFGQFRQRMLRDDFTFEALERRERVREGRPLTADESAALREYADRVARLEKRLADAQAALEDANTRADAASTYKALIAEMAKVKPGRKLTPATLKANADASLAALRAELPLESRSGDLFGAPTMRDLVDAERRKRDERRDGRTSTGRTDMAAGEGELFAGERPEQADLDPPRERRGDDAGGSTVDEVTAAARATLGPVASRHVTVVASPEDPALPAQLRARVGRRTEAFFDPATGRVYLIASRIAPGRAGWVAGHEVAGHVGIRGMLDQFAYDGVWPRGKVFADAFDVAITNPTVRQLADLIAEQNPDYRPDIAAEEALAELAAAIRTGNYDAIEAQYGITVPHAQRATLRGVLERLIAAIRRLFGGYGANVSDADVYRFLNDAWRHVKRGGGAFADPNRARQSRAAPVFFSAAARAVQQGKGAPKRADASGWKGWLDGAVRRGEMKQAERDWLGIDAWLDGRGQTTRDELADFIRANEVKVDDVVLGEFKNDAGLAEMSLGLGVWLDENIDPNTLEDGDAIDFGDVVNQLIAQADEARADGNDAEATRLDNMADEARRIHNREQPRPMATATKFGQYVLPGGKNYRELLLTMPERTTTISRFKVVNASGATIVATDNRDEADRYVRRFPDDDLTVVEDHITNRSDKDFHGGHFDQPNVLAHVRFNERTDADGKRVLFIEEIQSDWHQKGRRQGYDSTTSGLDAEVRRGGNVWQVEFADGRTMQVPLAIALDGDAAKAIALEMRAGQPVGPIMRRPAGSIPNAPFKGTDEWAVLAFKRMARWAVDNGFERIAWTTGDVQNARYDLAKQVESISVRVRDTGTRSIAIVPKDGREVLIRANSDGVVKSVGGSGQQFDGKPLDEVVGKDMAEKIMAVRDEKRFTGIDLAIGGDGMRGFYDRILPKAVGRWAKPFGAKVGRSRFGRGDANAMNDGELLEALNLPGKGDGFDAHALDITDAMRDAVRGGQPLFSRQDSSRDLVVAHNTSARKLEHAMRMGGFAVPSLAVTRAGETIEGFGDITLIGDPELADPSKGAKAFGADVYSPRYPEIVYRLDAAAVKRLNSVLGSPGAKWSRDLSTRDLTSEKPFKDYLARTLGDDWRHADAEELAARVLREAGAAETTFEGFTNAGNRRYAPHTLANVVKKLKRDLRGGENWNYGVGSLRAHYTPQFRSVAQIRKESGRLTSADNFKKIGEEIDAEFFKVADALAPYSDRGKTFGFADVLINAFTDAAKMGLPRALREYGIEGVDAEAMRAAATFLGKLRDLPAAYFEVIQPRAVELNEFRAAVVPSDTSPELRKELERRGLDVVEYPAGDAAARREAVKQASTASDLLFSRAPGSAAATPTQFFHLSRVGAVPLAEGATTYTAWAAKMRETLGASMFEAFEDALPDVFAASQLLNAPSAAPEVALDPEGISSRDVYDLARKHVQAGVKGEDAVMAAVTKDVQAVAPDLTERDVRRLFSDYGKVIFPSKDADKVALRELRALVQMQESIDRLEEGLPALKTGPQRDKATQAIREKRRALNDLLKQQAKSNANDPERLATYQQARVTNLNNQIADLEKQIATGERPKRPKAPPPSAELAALIARRDQLRAERDAIDNPRSTREDEAKKRALKKLIEGVEARLQGKTPETRGPVHGPDSAEVAELKARLATLREALAAIERPKLSPDARHQRTQAKSIARQLAEVKARLAANDYARKPRPEPKELNAENKAAKLALAKVKAEFARRQFEADMAKRHPVRKVFGALAETANLARAYLTSVDFSALLRQGGFIALGHPVRALKGVPDMLRAFASEADALAQGEAIFQRPNAPLYKKFGLELTQDGGTSLSKMEEAFMSRWLQRMPRILGGGIVRGSARAYSTMLNRLRADSFDAMLAAFSLERTPTTAEGEAIANYINVATGRGHLGTKNNVGATGLNTVFFAPRLVASRFNLLALQPLYGGTMRTRAMILAEYARFIMGVSVVFALAHLAADDEDDDPLVTMDPRSSNFLKIKFNNTYLDPMTGLSQVTVFLARMISGETVTGTGDVVPLRSAYRFTDFFGDEPLPAEVPYGRDDAVDVAARFARTKLAPIPGAMATIASGTDPVGEPATPGSVAISLVVPISFQDVHGIMTDNGLPKGAAIFGLSLLGMGVQYRAPDINTVRNRLADTADDELEAEFERMRGEYAPDVTAGQTFDRYADNADNRRKGRAGRVKRDPQGRPKFKEEKPGDSND